MSQMMRPKNPGEAEQMTDGYDDQANLMRMSAVPQINLN